MRALLLTRCGCQQWRDIPDKTPPPQWNVPLAPEPVSVRDEIHMDDPLPVETRRFRLMDVSHYRNFAVYEEMR